MTGELSEIVKQAFERATKTVAFFTPDPDIVTFSTVMLSAVGFWMKTSNWASP